MQHGDRERAWGARLVVAVAVVVLLAAASAGRAAVIWESQERYVRYGTDSYANPSCGGTTSISPKTFADGFLPFNVSRGNPYPGNGASQTSSIGPLSIDAVGYAYNLGQSTTACFNHRQVAESYCSVWFTLTEPTEYTFIYDTIPSLSANKVWLQGPGGTLLDFYENPGFYEGVLEAGSWRFLASVWSEGPGYSGTSYSAHLILAPEPSGALVAVAGALLIGVRRRAQR